MIDITIRSYAEDSLKKLISLRFLFPKNEKFMRYWHCSKKKLNQKCDCSKKIKLKKKILSAICFEYNPVIMASNFHPNLQSIFGQNGSLARIFPIGLHQGLSFLRRWKFFIKLNINSRRTVWRSLSHSIYFRKSYCNKFNLYGIKYITSVHNQLQFQTLTDIAYMMIFLQDKFMWKGT